jgi:drug/metabolite transporter (DMT)-like permease
MAATVVLDQAAQQRRGQIYVALAAVAWSTAGLLQRQLSLDIATQVAGRALFATLALLAYVAVAERGRVVQACRSVGLAGVGFAICLAVASATFIAALNHTTVARVLFIQAVSPVLAALLARVLLGEPVTCRTAVAMAVALAGVGLMLGAPGSGDALGDGLAVVMAFAFALALVITRHRRDVSMAPATCLSQLLLLVVLFPLATPADVGGSDVVWLAVMGGTQIGLGLALLAIGARLIPAAQVGLITLLEVVLGPIWVWIALSEQPDTATLVGGAIVIGAIVVQTLGAPPREAAVPPP